MLGIGQANPVASATGKANNLLPSNGAVFHPATIGALGLWVLAAQQKLFFVGEGADAAACYNIATPHLETGFIARGGTLKPRKVASIWWCLVVGVIIGGVFVVALASEFNIVG